MAMRTPRYRQENPQGGLLRPRRATLIPQSLVDTSDLTRAQGDVQAAAAIPRALDPIADAVDDYTRRVDEEDASERINTGDRNILIVRSQLMSTKGKAAQDVAKTGQELIENHISSAVDGASPRVRQIVEQNLDQTLTQSISMLSTHQASQLQVRSADNRAANVSINKRKAVQSGSDTVAVQRFLDVAMGTIKEDPTKSESVIRNEVELHTADVWRRVIKSVALHDPGRALEILDEHEDDLGLDVVRELRRDLEVRNINEEATEVVDRLMGFENLPDGDPRQRSATETDALVRTDLKGDVSLRDEILRRLAAQRKRQREQLKLMRIEDNESRVIRADKLMTKHHNGDPLEGGMPYDEQARLEIQLSPDPKFRRLALADLEKSRVTHWTRYYELLAMAPEDRQGTDYTKEPLATEETATLRQLDEDFILGKNKAKGAKGRSYGEIATALVAAEGLDPKPAEQFLARFDQEKAAAEAEGAVLKSVDLREMGKRLMAEVEFRFYNEPAFTFERGDFSEFGLDELPPGAVPFADEIRIRNILIRGDSKHPPIPNPTPEQILGFFIATIEDRREAGEVAPDFLDRTTTQDASSVAETERAALRIELRRELEAENLQLDVRNQNAFSRFLSLESGLTKSQNRKLSRLFGQINDAKQSKVKAKLLEETEIFLGELEAKDNAEKR